MVIILRWCHEVLRGSVKPDGKKTMMAIDRGDPKGLEVVAYTSALTGLSQKEVVDRIKGLIKARAC